MTIGDRSKTEPGSVGIIHYNNSDTMGSNQEETLPLQSDIRETPIKPMVNGDTNVSPLACTTVNVPLGYCNGCDVNLKPCSPPLRSCDNVIEEENNNDIKYPSLIDTNCESTCIKPPEVTLHDQEIKFNNDKNDKNVVSGPGGSPVEKIATTCSTPQAPVHVPNALCSSHCSTSLQFVNMRQTKAVLLGEVGAGKTSLLNALRFQEAHLSPEGASGRTVGIEVHSVQLRPDLRLWVYDFGGHDTYHFSQQLFLSPKALYILTVNISDYDSGRIGQCLRHWYHILTSRLAGPVICVVVTHADQVEDQTELENRCADIKMQLQSLDEEHTSNLHGLLERMKQQLKKANEGRADALEDVQASTLRKPIKQLKELLANRPKCSYNISCVSSKTLSGIPQFCDNLVSIIMENENTFPGLKLPKSWVDLAEEIASTKSECPFMSHVDFVQLALKHGVSPQHVPSVLRHLQSSGVVLHYDDYRRNSKLKQYVFSNPNLLLSIFGLVFNHNYHQDEIRFVWKNAAILKLPQFDFEMLRRNLRQKAVIGEKLLKCFWDALGIKEDIFYAILSLLERFDLCYEVPVRKDEENTMPEGKHFMFPYLLKEKVPTDAKLIWPDQMPDGCVEFRISLEFLQDSIPFGFLEKVSVRINPYLEHRVNWKQGLVAFCSEGQDMIRIENMHRDITGRKKTTSSQPSCLLFSARVPTSRVSMARHILLLLAAVTNRVLIHYYPGVVGLWHVHCTHCITLSTFYPDLVPDSFPADNVVMATKSSALVKCCNCVQGEDLTMGDIFPPNISSGNTPCMMSSRHQQVLKRMHDGLLSQMDNRKLVTALLRKGLIDVQMAETVMSQPNSVERNQKLLNILPLCGDLAFSLLVDMLKGDPKTVRLAHSLKDSKKATKVAKMPSIKRDLANINKPTLRTFWIVGTPKMGAGLRV